MIRRAVPAALAVAFLAACGDSTAGPPLMDTSFAACDWTTVATTSATVSHPRACQQVLGPVAEIEAGKPQCTSSSPAAVVRDTCPATGGAGLVGCCTYRAYGLLMTWCYYDPTLYPGVEARCRNLTVDGDPAVWTTTVPIWQLAALAP